MLAWRQEGGAWRLYLAAGLVGLSAGASYQVVLLSLPGMVMLAFGRERRPSRRELLGGIAVGVAATAAVIGFVVVRAGQEPAVNWGGATSVSRLNDLFRMKDFGFGTKTFGGGRLVTVGASATATTATTTPTTTAATTATTTASTTAPSGVEPPSTPAPGVGFTRLLLSPFRLLLYPLWAFAEAGPIAAVLGLIGAVGMWLRRLPGRLALLVILAGNVVGAGVVVGGNSVVVVVPPADRVVSLGGFFLGATIVFAVWAGVGASMVLGWAGSRVSGGRSRAERRRRDRTAPMAGFSWQPVVGGVLILTIIGMAYFNWSDTTHRTAPYARDYATNVFASVPQNAVLLTWGAERAFVLEEQQIVDHRRTDVEVIRLEQMNRPWYREQLNKRLGTNLGAPKSNELAEGAALATQLRASRPVFLDNAALYYVNAAVPDFGFRQRGLVEEAVDGKGKQATRPGDDGSAVQVHVRVLRLQRRGRAPLAERPADAGLHVLVPRLRECARQGERYDDAIAAFENALVIDPGNQDARKNLQIARQRKAGG